MHPDPSSLYPIAGIKNTVFLKPLLEARQVENVSVGDYTYYSDFDDPTAFFENNVRYNFGMTGANLRIGKFCALAHGATFIMADANHATVGPSTPIRSLFSADPGRRRCRFRTSRFSTRAELKSATMSGLAWTRPSWRASRSATEPSLARNRW